jgi:tetratricopeptide (TPR) repeat protein
MYIKQHLYVPPQSSFAVIFLCCGLAIFCNRLPVEYAKQSELMASNSNARTVERANESMDLQQSHTQHSGGRVRPKRPNRLRMVIRNARDVPPPSWVGMKEPYCSLRLNGQHYKSAIAADAEHPEWNETVVFIIDNVMTDLIEVRLWEDDFDAEKIGVGHFKVSDLTRGDWRNIEVTLEGGQAGPIKVRLGLFAVNFGDRVSAKEASLEEPALQSSSPRHGNTAVYSPRVSIEQNSRGFVESLHAKLHELREDFIHAHGEVDQVDDFAAVVHSAMELERRGLPDEAANVLSHVVRISHTPLVSSLALNNLACVEKRRGNHKIAVHHLERAADCEGGMEVAEASTLLNLAVAYTALGHYPEAAAVAHHAVKKLESDPTSRPALRATGYHNLGVALEACEEFARAADAFDSASACLPVGHPTRSTFAASAQRNREAANPPTQETTKQWQRKVQPSLITQSAKTLRSEKLPPLQADDHRPVPGDTISHQHVPLGRKLAPLPEKTKEAALQDATVALYAAPQQSKRLLRVMQTQQQQQINAQHRRTYAATPDPVKSKSPATSTAMIVRTATPEPLTVSVLSNATSRSRSPRQPGWNSDPCVKSPTWTQKPLQIIPNYDLEQQVNNRWIPKKLFPIIEDLRYKENTRRAAILREWRRQCHAIASLMRLQQVVAQEDEARTEIMIDQARVTRVLRHWVRGRLVFCEGCIRVEQEETMAREKLAVAATADAHETLRPYAATVQLLAAQEVARLALEAERQGGLDVLEALMECELAQLRAADRFKDSHNPGLAAAMIVWAFECQLSPEDALEFVNPTLQRSLHVQERYATFGIPGSHRQSQVLQRASSTVTTPTNKR